jgi:hypothetical protein
LTKPKIGDVVITPRGNLGTVLSLSVCGKDATVAVEADGRSYNVTLPRDVLKVMVKK